jgi:Protein of unknown function (DUF5674)
MQTIIGTIKLDELKKLSANTFGHMIKAVVDVEKELLAVDAELHSDLEAMLLEDGSHQQDLWGINLYPQMTGDNFIEFDSMINLRPSQGNLSRGVEDEKVRQIITAVVRKKVVS